MNMKRMVMVAAMAAVMIAHAAVSVTGVKAMQRYPWNGMVDIDYTIVCDDANADVCVFPNGVDADRGDTIPMLTLTGEGAGESVKAGRHRMTWDAAKDAPGCNTQNFKVTMTAVSGAALYIVVDLSGGVNAETYPVRSSKTGPDLSDDACRTTNLWLRLIPPGTFTMGGRATDYPGASARGVHEVVLTKPFYMGVFECTQRQWELVMGTRPSIFRAATYYATRPVEGVSYNDVRGTLVGAEWPAHAQVDEDSFMGRLRARTALQFDLPTEAQWEYACRAGTTTALNSGKNLANNGSDPALNEVGRNYRNGGSGISSYSDAYSLTTAKGTAKVGSYRPNAWGLYDMHGNVYEWCLDWWQSQLGNSAVTDPVGPASSENAHIGYSYRVQRGGSWSQGGIGCISTERVGRYPSDTYWYNGNGFRLCCSMGL